MVKVIFAFVLVGMILGLMSCQKTVKHSVLDKRFAKEKSVGVLGFDREGKPFVLDAKTGQKVATCKERENTKNPCVFDMKKQAGKLKILGTTEIKVIRFIGSCCEQYTTPFGVLEVCSPTNHPHPGVCGE